GHGADPRYRLPGISRRPVALGRFARPGQSVGNAEAVRIARAALPPDGADAQAGSSGERVLFVSVRHVPQGDGTVCPARGNLPALRGERNPQYPTGMTLQARHLPAAGRIPQAHRAILAAGDDRSAVGRKPRTQHRLIMSLQLSQLSPTDDVPEARADAA